MNLRVALQTVSACAGAFALKVSFAAEADHFDEVLHLRPPTPQQAGFPIKLWIQFWLVYPLSMFLPEVAKDHGLTRPSSCSLGVTLLVIEMTLLVRLHGDFRSSESHPHMAGSRYELR